MKADLKWDGIYHLAIWNSYLEMAMICMMGKLLNRKEGRVGRNIGLYSEIEAHVH
jgi:hypothetical protein